MSARTPFITGQDYTLFHNEQILSSGTVGIALSGERLDLIVEHTGFKALSEPMEITKSQGNIVLEVQGLRASRLLVDQVSKTRNETFKDDSRLFVKLIDGDKDAIVAVTGGDITKGALALDTTMDIRSGMLIQFLRYSANTVSDETAALVRFGVQDKEGTTCVDASNKQGLIAHSEEGVLYAHENVLMGFQHCNVAGSSASLK